MTAIRVSDVIIACCIVLQVPATMPAQTAKPAKPAASRPSSAKATPREPEVLTNEAVIRMVAAGLDEETILAKINSSPAAFTLDTDHLIKLKEAKIPQRVLRAMLG